MCEQRKELQPEDLVRELAALSAIVEALAPLDKDQRERILRYVRSRFGIYMGDDS